MKRRAAIVTPGAYPVPSQRGGSVERVVEKVAPRLAAGADVRVYGRRVGGMPRFGRLGGATLERYSAVSKRAYLARVRRSLSAYRPEVIQIENRPRWAPVLKRDFPRCRIWLNLHSVTFLGGRHLGRTERLRCLRAADVIQVNSGFLGSHLQRLAPEIAHKIRINPLGVEAERFPGRSTTEGRTLRERLRRERGWEGRRIALFAGRLIPQKGVHHLLAAWRTVAVNFPDALLVILGSPFYGSSRQTRYARRLKMLAGPTRGQVFFQPYVPYDRMPGWFAMADLAVVPSVGKEAFGLVNVEAMAAELPVVATRAGGIAEIVRDGETGFLVSPRASELVAGLASRIGQLLEDSELRAAMGRNGRERVLAHYLWEHTAARWLQTFEER